MLYLWVFDKMPRNCSFNVCPSIIFQGPIFSISTLSIQFSLFTTIIHHLIKIIIRPANFRLVLAAIKS